MDIFLSPIELSYDCEALLATRCAEGGFREASFTNVLKSTTTAIKENE